VAAWVETSVVHVPALFVTDAANVISRALKVGVRSTQECESRFDLLMDMQASFDPMESIHSVMPLAIKAFEAELSA
jgi:hypothetical protein